MKKSLGWILGAVVLMIGLPWLAAEFAGSAGMAVCFILFFGVNPIFSLLCGLAAGKAVRRRWRLSLLPATLFLAGAWLFFSPLDTAFFYYAAVYLLITVASMGVRALFH